MEIRKAKIEELDEIMEIFEHARQFMAKNGNASQWGTTYPEQEIVEADIKKEECYVCVENGKIEATFVFFMGKVEPNYVDIYDGEWKNEAPYGTIHRVASRGRVPGISKICMDFCKSKISNLRGDTYKDNIVMQKVFAKNGFEKCGTIYLAGKKEDGNARIAYQFVGK